jgi:hypothetical protein
MRRVVAAVLAAIGLAFGAAAMSPAEATDARLDRLNRPNHWAPPPARTPSVLRGGDPGIQRHDGGHDGRRHWDHGQGHHRPGVVFFGPRRCWQPGYWAQQWVPQAYTYNTWVAGQWSPDGRWVEGHYAPYVHHAGYYRSVWVEGYWTEC